MLMQSQRYLDHPRLTRLLLGWGCVSYRQVISSLSNNGKFEKSFPSASVAAEEAAKQAEGKEGEVCLVSRLPHVSTYLLASVLKEGGLRDNISNVFCSLVADYHFVDSDFIAQDGRKLFLKDLLACTAWNVLRVEPAKFQIDGVIID